jgi:hypothetical protein
VYAVGLPNSLVRVLCLAPLFPLLHMSDQWVGLSTSPMPSKYSKINTNLLPERHKSILWTSDSGCRYFVSFAFVLLISLKHQKSQGLSSNPCFVWSGSMHHLCVLNQRWIESQRYTYRAPWHQVHCLFTPQRCNWMCQQASTYKSTSSNKCTSVASSIHPINKFPEQSWSCSPGDHGFWSLVLSQRFGNYCLFGPSLHLHKLWILVWRQVDNQGRSYWDCWSQHHYLPVFVVCHQLLVVCDPKDACLTACSSIMAS